MNGKLTTTTIAVQISGPQPDLDTSLGAEFRYDPADPFAVTMLIESVSGPVCWTFARELIISGLFEPTGDGDVHVWPCLDTHGAAVVIIELNSPVGGAILQIASRAVHDFVSASLATVAQGAEQHDVDGWIEHLLAGTDTASN